MIPPGGAGHHLGTSAALASVLAFAGLVQSCPPLGSRFVYPDGFLRDDTGSDLSRRWTAIIPGDGKHQYNDDGVNHNGKQWPGGLIPICYDPALTEDEVEMFNAGLRRGMAEWNAAGLSSAAFRIDDSLTQAQCVAQGVTGPKENYLWVQRAEANGDVAASYGNQESGSILHSQPDSYFRTVNPSLDEDELAVEKVRTYAHEIGHVFGLQHEQKNPIAWSKARGGIGSADYFTFHCENLNDYDACRALVAARMNNNQAQIDEYMTEMCSSIAQLIEHPCSDEEGEDAVDTYLTVNDWLPELGGTQFTQFGNDVDMKSIMLYTSYGGGKEPGAVVYEVANPFLGPPIITFDGGYSSWPPSPQDVEGAYMLSPNPRDSTDQAPFFTGASPFNSIYENQDNPFNDCHAGTVSRRGVDAPNKRYEQLQRRGAETRAAMRRRLVAGSYI